MSKLPRPAALQNTLAACGTALVVASIHGVLPLTGFVSQLLAVVGPLGATGCFAAIIALRERAEEEAVDVIPVDELTGLASRDGLFVELGRLYRETTLDTPTQLILLDLVGFKAYNDTFGRPAGDALLRRISRNLRRLVSSRGSAYRLDGAEFAALVAYDSDAPDLADFVASALKEEGEAFSVTPCYGTVLIPNEAPSPAEAMRLANERLYALKHALRPQPQRHGTEVLMAALDKRSPAHGDHVRGVSELVEALSRKLGLTAEEMDHVRLAAELHDIGKVALPQTILEKRFPLDEEEWDYVRRHPLMGERVLKSAPALGDVAKLVRWSHERFDGYGYPDGLDSSEIPLGARILAVCDAFDAMISPRPYRKALSPQQAIAELRKEMGAQFDPIVVEAFCTVMEERNRLPLAS
jgi:two-component system, cell cycle response regulator